MIELFIVHLILQNRQLGVDEVRSDALKELEEEKKKKKDNV